jgi:hypothetical protein
MIENAVDIQSEQFRECEWVTASRFDERRKLDEDAPGSQMVGSCNSLRSLRFRYGPSVQQFAKADLGCKITVFECIKEHHDVNGIEKRGAVTGLTALTCTLSSPFL